MKLTNVEKLVKERLDDLNGKVTLSILSVVNDRLASTNIENPIKKDDLHRIVEARLETKVNERQIRYAIEVIEYEKLKDALFRKFHCDQDHAFMLLGSTHKGYFLYTTDNEEAATKSYSFSRKTLNGKLDRVKARSSILEFMFAKSEPTLFDSFEIIKAGE